DGRVFAQHEVAIPFGTRGEALVPALASAAARGILQTLERLERGTSESEEQDHARATRAPRPTAREQRLDPSWDARRLFAFLRGGGRWNRRDVRAGDLWLRRVDAEHVDEGGRGPGDWALLDDRLHLACREGSVALKVVPVPGG